MMAGERSSKRRGWLLGLALLGFTPWTLPARTTPDGEAEGLRRRSFFGAALGPLDEAARKAQGLGSAEGVAILRTYPGSAAEEAGLKPGDVLLAIDGDRVVDPSQAVDRFGKAGSGETVQVDLAREGGRRSLKVRLKERPREAGGDAFEVEYGAIPNAAGRLRTVVNRPKTAGRHPALLLIQGLGCATVESPIGPPGSYRRIVEAFATAGYVAMRVDKPGCGDSAGGPCPEVDFLSELDGYRQALKTLKGREDVDPARVLVFGHSMGGVMAPTIAAEEPVLGVAVFGTVFKTWYEYDLENRRRQRLLEGASYAEVDRVQRAYASVILLLLGEKQEPTAIVATHPELAPQVAELVPDGRHMYGRSLAFFRQLFANPTPESWARVDAHVLAIWGKAEFVSTEADHAMIADAVNRAHPGKGTFLALDATDHAFSTAASPEVAYRNGLGQGEFNPAVLEALRRWADTINPNP